EISVPPRSLRPKSLCRSWRTATCSFESRFPTRDLGMSVPHLIPSNASSAHTFPHAIIKSNRMRRILNVPGFSCKAACDIELTSPFVELENDTYCKAADPRMGANRGMAASSSISTPAESYRFPHKHTCAQLARYTDGSIL